MGAILGISADFCVEVNRLDTPRIPPEMLMVVVIVSIASSPDGDAWCKYEDLLTMHQTTLGTLYTLCTLILHISGVVIKYLISTVLDTVFVALLIACAAVLGRPLTNISCPAVGQRNRNISSLADVMPDSIDPTGDTKETDKMAIIKSWRLAAIPHGTNGLESVGGLAPLGATVGEVKQRFGDYYQWVGRVARWCTGMKVVWGLCIVGVFIMLAGAVVSGFIWRKTRRVKWEAPNIAEHEGLRDDEDEGNREKYEPTEYMGARGLRSSGYEVIDQDRDEFEPVGIAR